ncbi:Do family serine endopeptidase [Candidatus Acidulodesulfobacterium sp. H_13]|uniref:Do family serine endopeptidase n=1 Tax=Candidatus Acidulodesulfobacterium sp. H_13 TaxID=3395470 RepID=UPI003AF6B15B
MSLKSDSKIIGASVAVLIGIIAGVIVTANLHLLKKSMADGSAPIVYATNNSKVPAQNGPSNFVALIKKDKPFVVNIRTTQQVKSNPFQMYRNPFGNQENPFGNFFKNFFNNVPRSTYTEESLGSGVIISKNGYIITNDHVIKGASKIYVKLYNGSTLKARVIGKDPQVDLALLKVDDGNNLPSAVLGNSRETQIGEWVLAIGNPFGLGWTVTNGIVSAKGRAIGGPYEDFLQTNAAINPGNSGGPLINMKGQVIGINTAIIKGAQGIGFSVPVNVVKEVLPELETGKITRGWLGIEIQKISPALKKVFKLKTSRGALVSSVLQGSPAAKAGLKSGDVIIRLDGKKVKEMSQLPWLVGNIKPGTKVPMEVIRHGKRITLMITIGSWKSPRNTFNNKTQKVSAKKLGIIVVPLTSQNMQEYGIQNVHRGVIVSKVIPGGIGQKIGIMPGDVIQSINHKVISNIKQYVSDINRAKKSKQFLFYIRRGNMKLYLAYSK